MQESLQFLFCQEVSDASFILDSGQNALSNPVDQLLIHAGHGGAAPFQRTSDVAPAAIFNERFQRNAAFHIFQKGIGRCLIREFPGSLESFVGGIVRHIEGDEGIHIGFFTHSGQPVIIQSLPKLAQRQAFATVIHKMLDRDAEGGRPGAGIDEACAVRRVLHIVAESKEFFVIVKLGGIDTGNPRADGRGASQTDKDHTAFRPAARAQIIIPLCLGREIPDRDRILAANRAFARTLIHLDILAVRAIPIGIMNLRFVLFCGRTRIKQADMLILRKILIIERIHVADSHPPALIYAACPAGCAAVAAVHNREVSCLIGDILVQIRFQQQF